MWNSSYEPVPCDWLPPPCSIGSPINLERGCGRLKLQDTCGGCVPAQEDFAEKRRTFLVVKFTLAESGCNMSARPGCTNLTHPGAEQDIVESLPVLVLNVHSRCNCRCIMCDIWKREEASEIRVADLERHRVALRRLGVRWVVLTGGEPLMHSDLAALCAWLRADDIRLTLLTTGLLLWKRAALVARFFADVIVS